MVGSFAGLAGLPRVGLYASTKHALLGYFNSLRHDFQSQNSNVSITTCILGAIATENAKRNAGSYAEGIEWSSPETCAERIVQGGESRVLELYYPLHVIYPATLLRLSPTLLQAVLRQVG